MERWSVFSYYDDLFRDFLFFCGLYVLRMGWGRRAYWGVCHFDVGWVGDVGGWGYGMWDMGYGMGG